MVMYRIIVINHRQANPYNQSLPHASQSEQRTIAQNDHRVKSGALEAEGSFSTHLNVEPLVKFHTDMLFTRRMSHDNEMTSIKPH